MKYRKIGNTDISVSEIGFGAWSIAMNWWGKAIDEQEAKRMIKKRMMLESIFLKQVTCRQRKK